MGDTCRYPRQPRTDWRITVTGLSGDERHLPGRRFAAGIVGAYEEERMGL